MNERNIATLREIIELQKQVCRNFVSTYGIEHGITKDALFSLGKMIFIYEQAKARCKV